MASPKTSISMTKEVAEKAQGSFLCRNDIPKYAGGGVSEFVEIAVRFTLQTANSVKERQKVIDFFTNAHESLTKERVEALMSQYSIANNVPAPKKKRGRKPKAKK